MTNIVPFPLQSPQPPSIGVRVRSSPRDFHAWEVQKFEEGAWRAKSVHDSEGDADQASKKLVEAVVVQQAKHALDAEFVTDRQSGRVPDLIYFDTSKAGTYLLLWADGAKRTFHLTRFVDGHEECGYRFTTFEEALDAAEMCNRLGHIDVEISRGL